MKVMSHSRLDGRTPKTTLEIFLILASDSDSNRSQGVERGPHYQIRSPSPLLTLTHLVLLIKQPRSPFRTETDFVQVRNQVKQPAVIILVASIVSCYLLIVIQRILNSSTLWNREFLVYRKSESAIHERLKINMCTRKNSKLLSRIARRITLYFSWGYYPAPG